MAQEMVLLSPEKAVLSFRLAGLASRVMAHIFDLFVYGAWMYVANLVVVVLAAAGSLDEVVAEQLLGVIAIVSIFLYFILFEALWNGQTLGKRAMSIRVRMADGTPVTFAGALGRNLLRPADFLPALYFIGLIAMFTNTKSQRLGDLAAGTIVVHDRRAMPIFQPAPHAFGEHRFESEVGELRGMTIEEYVALKRFCDRYPELSQQAQHRFLKEVWEPVAARRGVKPVPNVHPLYLAEAVVMKYGRTHGLL